MSALRIQLVMPGCPKGAGLMRLGSNQDRRTPRPIDRFNLLDRVDPVIQLNSSCVGQGWPSGPPGRMEDVPVAIDELDVWAGTGLRVAVELEDSHGCIARLHQG